MMNRPQHTIEFEGRIMELVEKVCATSKCVWCAYRTDQYFITCPMCRNCQYCGYVDEVDPYRCFICGNYLPEEAQTPITQINAY
jgi:hypothetical protein